MRTVYESWVDAEGRRAAPLCPTRRCAERCLSLPRCKGAWGLPPSPEREHARKSYAAPSPAACVELCRAWASDKPNNCFRLPAAWLPSGIASTVGSGGRGRGTPPSPRREVTRPGVRSAACRVGVVGGHLRARAEVPLGRQGAHLAGCQAGSGSAGVEGGGRLRRGASLPAGIGRLEPAALALAGRTQSESARPPRCQGWEQARGSCSAPAVLGLCARLASSPRPGPPASPHSLTAMAN